MLQKLPQQSDTAPQAQMVEQTFFWIFIAGLAWVPFWFGSNTLEAWGINAVVFPGFLLLYEISILVQCKPHPVGIKHIKAPFSLFVAALIWIAIQNSQWTSSSFHHPIWSMTADALGHPVAGSISIDRDLTTLGLVRLMTAAAVFWLALQLCRDPLRARQFIYAIATVIFTYATYGLISLALTPGYVLWVKLPFVTDIVRSTFINRNSFATYAGIGLIAIYGVTANYYERKIDHISSLRLRLASTIEATGRQGAILLSGAFVIFVALLMTGSRGGIFSTVFGLAIYSVLTFIRRRAGGAAKHEFLFYAAILIGITFLIFGDLLYDRLMSFSLSDSSRVAVYRITLRSILDSPILGYGYGTFADVFPIFRDQSLSVAGTWEQAHNTYLEIFQGLGLLFGSLLPASILILVVRCVRTTIARRNNVLVPAVAASVSFLAGVNAVFDFSLQIQAITLTFAALLGAGVAQSKSSRRSLGD